MSRNRYRHKVRILRRDPDNPGGGHVPPGYLPLAETSCEIRDETETEFAAAESARVEHVKTFTMRARDIRSDDILVWMGEAYRVRRVDGVFNNGREIRVRASLTKSRYTVKG